MVDDDGQCMVGWDRWDIHEALHTSDILWPLIFCIAQSCGSLAVALRRANATNADKCNTHVSYETGYLSNISSQGDPGSVWVYVLETNCTDRHWKTNCSNLHSFQWHRLWTLGPNCSCSHRGNLRIVLRTILCIYNNINNVITQDGEQIRVWPVMSKSLRKPKDEQKLPRITKQPDMLL